jgi:CheY-like chemotaxis protein
MTTSPARILVVDDNEALRDNLAEALVLEGYEVAVARDGAGALELLEGKPFDAVLLDLMMPGMDGREVLAHIRQDPRLRDVRVVMTTGYSGPRVRAGVPADAFLLKPFGVRELLAALRQVGIPAPAADDTAA